MYTLGERRIETACYYNTGPYAWAIVASIREGVDWTVYMSGCDPRLSEEEAVVYVRDYGIKMPEAVGRFYFPNMTLPYRR